MLTLFQIQLRMSSCHQGGKGTFLTFVKEHCMVESWLFRKMGFRSHFRQNSRIPLWDSNMLGTLQLQVFPEALGIFVCILAFTPYFTVQYNNKKN
jgi:hypothetical protein